MGKRHLSTSCMGIMDRGKKQACVNREIEERRRKYHEHHFPHYHPWEIHDFEEKWDLDTDLDLLRTSNDNSERNDKRTLVDCDNAADKPSTRSSHRVKARAQQNYMAAANAEDPSALEGIDSLRHFKHNQAQAQAQQPILLPPWSTNTIPTTGNNFTPKNCLIGATILLWVLFVAYHLFIKKGNNSSNTTAAICASRNGGRNKRADSGKKYSYDYEFGDKISNLWEVAELGGYEHSYEDNKDVRNQEWRGEGT